jgi:hypothetical protein
MAIASIASKKCPKCGARKPLSEFGKSKSTKDGLRVYCKLCHRADCLEWRSKNPNYRKNYYSANKGAEKEKSARRDRRAYYLANKEVIIERCLQWAKNNAARCAARAMQRIAIKNLATPTWADISKIQEIYQLAERKRIESGEMWHVDHIVPLKSKTVCGLHVACNLQLLRAAENVAKSNRHWPDMPT